MGALCNRELKDESKGSTSLPNVDRLASTKNNNTTKNGTSPTNPTNNQNIPSQGPNG